jgi:hypothetical protein
MIVARAAGDLAVGAGRRAKVGGHPGFMMRLNEEGVMVNVRARREIVCV